MNILIVEESMPEDKRIDLEALRRQLAREFPSAVVYRQDAGTVLKSIPFASDRQFSYGVVILDCRQEADRHNPADWELVSKALSDSPVAMDAAVFHIVDEVNSEEKSTLVPSWVHPKKVGILDPLFGKTLFDAVCQFVYETRVERRLRLLFPNQEREEASPQGPRDRASRRVTPRMSPRAGFSATHSNTLEMNSLVHDIEQHWGLLRPHLRDWVMRVFPLNNGDDSQGGVQIKLF